MCYQFILSTSQPPYSLLLVRPSFLSEKKKPTKNMNSSLSSCRRPDKQHTPSNFQFTIDTLVHDVKGISKNPFTTVLERSNSLEAILHYSKDGKLFLMSLRFPSRRISRWQSETDQPPQPSTEGSPRILRYPRQGFEPGESGMPYGDYFNVTSSDPLPTSDCFYLMGLMSYLRYVL
jgi:hypothetical protein